MTVIKTRLGRYFDLAKPRQQEYPIEEIAWHLAHIARFTGAAEVPVSVAYHSVRVSHNVLPGFAMAGLLHDAEEAYYGDISSPAKKLVGKRYLALADAARETAMLQHGVPLGIQRAASKWVHEADAAMLRIEVMFFTAPEVAPHPQGFAFEARRREDPYWARHAPDRRRNSELFGEAAANAFLLRYYELQAEASRYYWED